MANSTIAEKIVQAETERQRIAVNIAVAYDEAEAKGATMPQLRNSNNLATTIGSISTGGGTPVERKDVNFFDYDGTLLHSYTFSEALQLTSPPALPTRTGLTAQEWNWTLEQIQSYAQSGYPVNVGATYTTSDGSTRLYLFVAKGTRIHDLQIWVTMAANSSATIDWGDGTFDTLSNTGSSAQPVYAEKTDYATVASDTVLCARIVGGSFLLGRNNISYTIFGNQYNDSSQDEKVPTLMKVELGSNCTGISTRAFNECYTLSELVISRSATSVQKYAFNGCSCLRAVVFPNVSFSIGQYAFNACNGLEVLSFPKQSMSAIQDYAFSRCYNLSSVAYTERPTMVYDHAFSYNTGLIRADIPEGILQIRANAFSDCSSLVCVKIPQSVTNIGSSAFSYCRKLSCVDMRAYTDPTQIPALASTNAFSYTAVDLVIYVANQQMLSAFSSATNWSNYASKFATA